MKNPIPAFDAATVTLQQVFDFVALKIIEQGRPAVSGGTCRYRLEVVDHDEETIMLKCGAGQLLPDEEYEPHLDFDAASLFFEDVRRPNFSELVRRFGLVRIAEQEGSGAFTGNAEGFSFLRALQRAHDEASRSYSPITGGRRDSAAFLRKYRINMGQLAKLLILDDSILRFQEPPAPVVMTIPGLDLATASRQDVFDFVALQIIKQGKPSVRISGQSVFCQYRAEDGAKCAGGQIIPDPQYTPNFEGDGISSLISSVPALDAWTKDLGDEFAFPGSMLDRVDFLIALQVAHDHASRVEAGDFGGFTENPDFLPSYRWRMRDLARKYQLDDSILFYREAQPCLARPDVANTNETQGGAA